MIHGVGTDIVLIARIRSLVERRGERFARRVLGPGELDEYRARRGRGASGPEGAVRYLAKRFAAKEAFAKAVGLGVRGPATLLSLQVLNGELGRPVIVPGEALGTWLSERALVAHVSLSDEVDCALAFVVIERNAPGRPAAGPGP